MFNRNYKRVLCMDTENQFSEKNEINSRYDVIIIGAGPAEMFAAYELAVTDRKSVV